MPIPSVTSPSSPEPPPRYRSESAFQMRVSVNALRTSCPKGAETCGTSVRPGRITGAAKTKACAGFPGVVEAIRGGNNIMARAAREAFRLRMLADEFYVKGRSVVKLVCVSPLVRLVMLQFQVLFLQNLSPNVLLLPPTTSRILRLGYLDKHGTR